tara:strand:- start:2381 stop:3529 length:1149 start_codon:yes stop_codon:yes gene_type:complete
MEHNFGNVVSLFDGMSCTQIALQRMGIVPKRYFASEVDKYAITVAKANFPDTIHVGDVRNVIWPEIFDGEPIDLLIGGSPCQGFSFAGGQLAFDDPRSKLFFEFVRVLKECKPKYFLLENVNMKQEFQDVINEQLGCKPVDINSNLVSAQNRRRLYWTNIPVRSLPENKRIYLKDILEDGFTDRDKAHCVDANYFKGGNLKSYFEKHRRQLIFDFAEEEETEGTVLAGHADLKGHDYNRRVYHPDGKAPTLAAASGGNLEPKVLYPASIVGRRLNNGVRDDYNKDVPVSQCLEVHDTKGKARCLSTVEKDTLVSPLPEGRYPDAYNDEMRLMWRKLTCVECERLQTVPDNYTAHVSNTQRYKMLGNGFTVDVIRHLLGGMDR